MPDNTKAFAPFRCVASFADGSRLAFDGVTREQARATMEAAMEEHGDLGGWNWVTDENYIDGAFHKLAPPPPKWPFPVLDLTDADDPEKALQDPFDPDGEP